MEYKVAIIGSREFTDYNFLESKALELIPSGYDITIVSGGARGADTLAEQFAKKFGYELEIHRAKWHTHGKCAGYLRNHEIVRNADMVIAFWNGVSRGTQHTINISKGQGRKVYIFRVDDLIKKEK